MQPLRRPIGAEHHRRILDVRRRQLRPRAREQPRLRGSDGERTLAEQQILQAGLHHACLAQHDVVDGDREPALADDARLIVILHALPDTGQVMRDRDAEIGQMLLRPDAGQQQQLRRVDRAAAQDDLARGAHGAKFAVLAERHAGGAAAVQRDALGQCIGDDAQIGPLHRRTQIADRGGATPAVARGELVVADAFLDRAVEVVIARDSRDRARS